MTSLDWTEAPSRTTPQPSARGVVRIDDADYVIGAPIGRGALAEVFEAVELRSGAPCVVKIAAPHAISSTEFSDRLTAAQKQHHPHLLPILGHRVIDGTVCVVLPLVRDTLANVSTPDTALPLMHCQTIARQIADAMSGLHTRGVVHGNITPSNVLLRVHTEHFIDVALADLGLGNACLHAMPLPRPGWMLANIGFAAPEQHHSPAGDIRTDIYGLAATLWWVLTGTAPLPTEQPLVGSVPTMRDGTPMPMPVRDTLERALARNPAMRGHSIAAFANAFSTACTPVPEVAHPRRLPRRNWWFRAIDALRCSGMRSRRVLAVGTALLAVGAGMFAWREWRAYRETRAHAALRAAIPVALQPCHRAPRPKPASSALTCRDTATDIQVTYIRFQNSDALNTWFTSTAGNQPASALAAGSCANGLGTTRAWRTRPDAARPSGLVSCTATPTGARVLWTTDTVGIGAIAESPHPLAPTWTWWQRTPGPVGA